MSRILHQIEGKYEILQKLREGGMGAIYKVRHRLLDELRVVKVMRPHLVADASMRRRFLHEARVAIKVRHTNVAQLFDFSMDADGTAMMVMEYIDGVTLQEVSAGETPPSVGLVVEIATQALRGLACLHHQGIVHRDISSDNLMLTRDFGGRPLVKLIDLGIAKDPVGASSGTVEGTFLGKVRYSPPEQFQRGGAASLTPASDIYSFGVMLYELLTGRFPLEGESFAELAAGHLLHLPLPFEESDPEGRVPEKLRELVLRLLEKDPADRPSSADEVVAKITAFRTEKLETGELDRRLADARAAGPKAEDLRVGGPSQQQLDDVFPPSPTQAPTEASPMPPSLAEVRPTEVPLTGRRLELDRLCALLAPGIADFTTSEIVATIDTMLPGQAVEPPPDRTRQEFEAVLAWARKKEASGELEQALQGFEKAQRLSPQDAELRQSVTDLRRRIEVARKADAVLLRGLEHLAHGELAQARECLRETDRLSTDTARSAPLREGLDRTEAVEFQRRLDEAVALSDGGEFADALDACARAAAIRPDDPGLHDLEARIRSAQDERLRTVADACRRLLGQAERDEEEGEANEHLDEATRELERLRALDGGAGASAVLVQEVGRVRALLEERHRERDRRIARKRDQGLAELEKADELVQTVGGDLDRALAHGERARGLLAEVLELDPSQQQARSAVERIGELLPVIKEERERRRAREAEVTGLLRRAAGALGDSADLTAVAESELREQLESLEEGRSWIEQARTLEPRHAKVRELTDRYAAFKLDAERELERRREERRRVAARRRSVLDECREIAERVARLESAGLTQVEQVLGEIEQAVDRVKQIGADEEADDEATSMLRCLRAAREDADRWRLALLEEDKRQLETRRQAEQKRGAEAALDEAESRVRELRDLESRRELDPERVEQLLQQAFEQVDRALTIDPDGQRAMRTRQRLEDYAARLRDSIEDEARRRAQEQAEAGLDEGRRLAEAHAHRKAIRHLEQVARKCRATIGRGELLRDIEAALAQSKAIVRKRFVRLIAAAATAVFCVAVIVVVWVWATRAGPLERELREISGLAETSEQEIRNKLARYSELLSREEFFEHRQNLDAAKERLTNLLEIRRRLRKLEDYHLKVNLGAETKEQAEKMVPILWDHLEVSLDRTPDDPTARLFRDEAHRAIREMALLLDSRQLRDLVEP